MSDYDTALRAWYGQPDGVSDEEWETRKRAFWETRSKKEQRKAAADHEYKLFMERIMLGGWSPEEALFSDKPLWWILGKRK
jgi:hypothetical protein